MEKIELLQNLENMRIEPEGAAVTFVKRLSQENGWSSDYAERVVAEYRRFLFLAATSGQPMTPSDEVDQAWHLHLTYSRHYWETMCGQILKKPLHHGPTAGGAHEDRRYLGQYARTLDAYARTFGHAPPPDIWPNARQRFGTEYRRVVAGQHWMVPKKAGYAVVPLLTLAACTPVGWAAGGILAGIILVLGTVIFAAVRAEAGMPNKKYKDSNSSGCGGAVGSCTTGDCGGSSSGDCGGGGGCGGGCGS